MTVRLTAPGLLLVPLVVAMAAAAAPSCGDGVAPPSELFTWSLPAHFPIPSVPADNPMNVEKVELGRHLFYETRLSVSGDVSCGTCHLQELAFTDGRSVSRGATGEETPRSAMSLANVAYNSRLTWANPLIDQLEHQALLPMFGDSPVEMGLSTVEDEVLAELAADGLYDQLFGAAFPDVDEPVSWHHVTQAIAAFERTLISGDSPYDRYLQGDEDALGSAERRGMTLFFSERLECFHCHGGFNFTDSVAHDGSAVAEVAFHNTGLYNLDGEGAYPERNTGVAEISGDPADMGRFRAPTLRNIAVTAPYMHDGSVATLGDVVDHYLRGGRRLVGGPHAGDGAESPLKSEFVVGFVLSDEERADLIAFLHALTDESFLSNPAFGAPALSALP